jgi:hypothetical protein
VHGVSCPSFGVRSRDAQFAMVYKCPVASSS